MLLTIDVGNTNTVLGVFASPSDDTPVEHWRAKTDDNRTADEWHALIHQFFGLTDIGLDMLDDVIIASVVPKVTGALERMFRRLHRVQPTVLTWKTPTGLPLCIDNPSEVGADRIANAVGAKTHFSGPSIVVDLGTATTLDVISRKGEYIGGVILPGLETSLEALFDRAAGLRRVSIRVPDTVVGRTTQSAVESGATYGFAAQIDRLCEMVEQEVGACTVIGTGGMASVIAPISSRIQYYEPWLTLRGLARIASDLQGHNT